MPPKLRVQTDKRPLKKVYLHPSGLQASVIHGVLERGRPILSEPKRTIGQRLKAKWTCGKQARIYAKGEFIGCSERTLSVTAENHSMPVFSNFCRQKFAQLEAKNTTVVW